MTPSGKTLPGARWLKLLLMMKAITQIGIWNVHTMYITSKATQVANEMRSYYITVLNICESRWNGSGCIILLTGEQVVYSGHENEQHVYSEGVAFMISKSAAKALIEWVSVSSLHDSTLRAERSPS